MSKKKIGYVALDGMTCRSCEVMIERKLKKIPQIESACADCCKGVVKFTYTTPPSLSVFQDALKGEKYAVKGFLKDPRAYTSSCEKKPTLSRLIGVFACALLLGYLVSKSGLLNKGFTLGDSIQFGAAFVLGLVAATSSCIATVGGLMVTSITNYQRQLTNATVSQRFAPIGLFLLGRVISYTILGGVIGLVGSLLTPSPYVTGGIVLLAAFYMVVMGLDMLNIAPAFLKRLMPRMPKAFSHRLMDMGFEGKTHFFAPFLTGASTFFIPCGFTQALQLFALTTGSFWTSAVILFAFSLGTVPMLGIFGMSLNAFRGKAREFVFHFSGALVIVMGLWNVQNGFTVMGYPLSMPSFPQAAAPAETSPSDLSDPNVTLSGGEQIVRMAVGEIGYEPNRFVLKAGVPTRWIVDGTRAGGCLVALQAPRLGISSTQLKPGDNVFRFTPAQPGTYTFSCAMGMFRGQFIVRS
jgi:uncharacterized protein